MVYPTESGERLFRLSKKANGKNKNSMYNHGTHHEYTHTMHIYSYPFSVAILAQAGSISFACLALLSDWEGPQGASDWEGSQGASPGNPAELPSPGAPRGNKAGELQSLAELNKASGCRTADGSPFSKIWLAGPPCRWVPLQVCGLMWAAHHNMGSHHVSDPT